MTVEQVRGGGTLRVGIPELPAGFDPAMSPSVAARVVMDLVYSTLTRLDPDGNVGPGAAEHMSAAPDDLAYTFRLRPAMTFHDGSPVTADDVAFSLERVRARGRDYAYWAWIDAIADIVVVDQLTVRIELSRACAALPAWLAFAGVAIVSRTAVEQGIDLQTTPIGSGPLRLTHQDAAGIVRLERAQGVDGRATPALDAIEFHVVPGASDRADALLTGAVDLADALSHADWGRVAAARGIVGAPIVDARYHWLMMNTAQAPFDNPLVRTAIAYAVDRTAIAERAFGGHAVPVGEWLPPWSWARQEGRGYPARADPERAAGLLRQAGVTGGFKTTITVGDWIPNSAAQADVVKENLGRIGILVDVTVLPRQEYLDDVWRDRRYEMSVMCWASPLSDPDDFVGGQFRWGRRNNVEQYSGATLTEAIDGALEISDRTQRSTAYRAIQRLLFEESPRVPTVFPVTLRAHTDRLRNYVPQRNGRLGSLADAWLAS